MIYVFDSSFIGALIIPDEKNLRVDKIRAGISEDETILVPRLLWYEMANIFKNLSRRRRFTADEVMQFYLDLAAIRLTCDNQTGINYSTILLRLCNDYNLSSYDAAYLELAERKKAVLCTMGESLKRPRKNTAFQF
jgi:predicted nucleic acid-binding protein